MKLCPICDHELIGNFCPVCKRPVTKPLIISDGIYLNKSHSLPDVNCEFHDGDRKLTLLNRRHPADEPSCSYHYPSDGFSPGGIFRKKEKKKNQNKG